MYIGMVFLFLFQGISFFRGICQVLRPKAAVESDINF